ncbi:MAG TPA: penicillin-binding protein activator LpoB [Cyclobacteriaceae bacterium]|nr:penicillin-binding protein activator LpoB [Cyclobacteriaceae bacterium]HNU42354.1 penicillin-binding protein activator LpoB [Cyclobacteriaceae bacterium]
MRIVYCLLLGLLLTACAQTVSRVDPGQPIDLSGRWNDTDSRQVAEKMISELLNSPRYKEYAKELGKRPTIIVGLIRNRTSEHIDANAYIKKFEMAIFNSNIADLVESDTFRDKLREERAQQQDFADPATMAQWGKEVGANLMLFGEMTSETDVMNKQRVVNYITTLFLTDMESNKRVWYGQHEIKKYIRK